MRLADVTRVAVNVIGKAVLFTARWAAASRRRGLEIAAARLESDKDKEIVFLRDRVAQLQSQVKVVKQLYKPDNTTRYTNCERLMIIFHITYFAVPRRKVRECFGVARSTLYRWLDAIDGCRKGVRQAWNRTAADMAALVWDVAQANAHWGRIRIANQLGLLGVFVAPSTVRNILQRPRPPSPVPEQDVETHQSTESEGRAISAFYPNHVWSVDLTEVLCWGLWTVYVIVAIDHFSRKVVCVRPLAGQSTQCIIDALELAFRTLGPPKHLISDRGSGFDSAEMTDFLKPFGVKQRFGAVGKHGSIAVTERVNRTLKEEWLRRVPLIRGVHHLPELCESFTVWHNEWRPHMTLGGCRPVDFYCRDTPEPVASDAKVVPLNIERRRFSETRTVGFRLQQAA
jgi:putative transposase